MGTLVKRLSAGALLLVFGLASMALGQTELLVNGGFESWDDTSTPSDWDKVESVAQEATEVYGGTYSAKHTGGTSDLAQSVAVTAGNSYTISLWYKVEAGTGDGTDARIWSYWKSSGSTLNDNADELRGPNNSYFDNNGNVWTEYTVTLDAPATADELAFEVRTYSGAVVYWDDISVVENASEPEDPNDYFIPQGSHSQGYESLKAAVDSINTNGVTGEINFVLDADTLREDSFTFTADLDADNNVTVKPAAGRDVVLIVEPGPSVNNGPQMIGFDKGYVTFDGSNDGSDSRNLIVTTETSTDVPFGTNTSDAVNIVIKNLIIKNLDNGAGSFKYGVISNDVGGGSFTVDNCQIGSPDFPAWRDGVAVWGDWTNGFAEGTVINNDIHAGARGISTYIAGPCEFANNNVTLYPTATTYSYNYGIYCSWVSGAEVYGNVVKSAEATAGGVTKVGGIVTASHPADAEFNVYNNMVSVADAAETVPVYGLLHMSSNDARNWNVYHNTFEVNGAGECYGIGNSSSGPVTMDLKNNIIINDNAGNTASAAINLVSTSTVLTSNNNILVSAEKLASLGGTDYADLADWQGAGYDTNSDSLAVTFTAADDLHLAAPSDTDLDLVMTSVGVMEDIDGDARGTFYAYAGADEGTAYPASNDLDLTFDDATDVANWSHYDETNVWTVESNVDSTLMLSDAGYGMIAKRPVQATDGSLYHLSIDIKTSGWDGPVDPLILSVEGLGNDAVIEEIVSEDTWTTFTLVGVADGEEGYIRIYGNNVGAPDTVWVDNVVWDDQYLELIPSSTVADARLVPDGDDVACIGVLTATTIGAPLFMQDETAGISLYDSYMIGDVEEGDEILAIGEADEYNGLIQIRYPIEFQILSKDNVVEPTLITVSDLDSRDYQGMLVMIEDVDTVAGDFNWPAEGSSATIPLVDESSNEFNMRIDSDGNMDGASPPDYWPLNLVGVVSEFYSPQIMPRYMDDFIANPPPGPFTVLNPVDGDTITSLDDPAFVDQTIGTETVKTLLVNWTEAADIADDTVTYEVMVSPDGPDQSLITEDTVLYIPIPEDKPWDWNGTYELHVAATDLKDQVTRSDTVTVTFDFKAPPEVKFADVVLVDGTPKYYAEFSMPILRDLSNYKFLDYSDGDATSDPTAIDSIAPNAILLSGDLPEDHWVALTYSGVAGAEDTASTPLTTVDTTWANNVLIPYSGTHPVDEAKTLEDFETDVGKFQNLTYSGSTSGILTTSTFDVSDEEAYQGSKSGKMTILDDPDTDGGWFVRIPYDFPSYNTVVKANSTIMLLVKGSNANVNIALTIKDSGYERNMWKRVTLCEDDWQVVSFDLLNDEAEGWITGNGVVEGETVNIADMHISCSEDADVTLYVDGFTERQRLDPVDVTLNVIMKKYVEAGDFSMATDYVDVAGTFNDWSGTNMDDLDSDTTYTVTLPLMPYSSHEFKFRINGSWDDATAEFPYGGPARTLTVGTSASEHTYWYNDDTLEVAVDGIPDDFALHQNYPNPFNPTTTINFDLPEASDVKLVIYDIAGRKIRTLVNGNNIDAGYKKIVWNGRDDYGNGVATGMYIYRLQAGEFVEVKKMTFLK